MKKIKLTFLILVTIALVLLITGSFAWFRYNQMFNTVSLVQMPSKIIISGAHRSEMTRISLELTPDDTQDENTVTIRRVFCIESTANFWLEVIRTTNIEEMDIKIYPVKANESDLPSGEDKGTDGLNTYYYNPDGESLGGDYLNNAGNGVAVQKGESNTLHGQNYLEDDNVQKNAEPLYWRTTNKETFNLENYCKLDSEAEDIKMYYRYYVLQLSWIITNQESDIVYLIASH